MSETAISIVDDAGIMPDLSQAKLLLVDDEPANLRLLEAMLRMEGYANTVSISDSREVEQAYREQRFDIVLLDINMPHFDGFQVLERLRQIDGAGYPPVLVLTAQSDTSTRLRALKAGARDFVTKPFLREEVVTRIRNLLEVRLMQNSLENRNRWLDEKVRERTRELNETRLEVIRRLGRAAEYRDNETGLHIIRMSKYSQVLGRAAGLSESEAELLLNASPMHDIGKIGIPDGILLKPGKLDPEEWTVMKTHASIGAEILSSSGSELLEAARVIAISHHEKWDGSGYPHGLAGDAIPFTGRIVAVADVFDALTTERPYKKAWAIDDAFNYIREQSGKHFDPALAGLFLRHSEEILTIRRNHAEPPHEAVAHISHAAGRT
ncbi:MAG: two-component system response regulator [Gammaproteobacteria bacterium]|nr:two-component system response regulator [Gammaproteobacteria bacterium]